MHLLNVIPGVLAVSSCVLLLWQWRAAKRFPLHQRTVVPDFMPAVSLLKPLKGSDDTTAASLESWLKQNYPGARQVLFGVADENDPVCDVVRDLIAKNPGSDAQLVICRESPGTNAKVATLIQLERLAKHGLILVSDADVRVPADFLANVVAPLQDEKVGLVNCFYRLANPTTNAMRWEAVAINADFWSQVLQSQSIKPLDFALGAVMLTRRTALDEIGGFTALADCLADDYQLGHRIAKKGHRIALCPVVVECWDSPKDWAAIWKHQLRWARTIRACQPLPYFFSIVSNATLWPLLWLAGNPALDALEWVALMIGYRTLTAVYLQRRLTQTDPIDHCWLVPVKDLLQAVIWFLAFTGNTVEWRGKKMTLRPDGTLEKI